MRIGKFGLITTLLGASWACFALLAQDQSSAPDVHQIVASSIAATQRHWQTRLRYTYVVREENRRLDPAGRVRSEDVDVSRTILIKGVPVEQPAERNGQPPSAEEERKHKEKLDKLLKETPEERAERIRKQEEEQASLVREVPKAFDFRMAGEDVVKGRQAWILEANPHPGYQAQGKYGKIFSRVTARFWVDKQDLGWIKVDAQVIQPFSIGVFLALVLRGSHITMEQTRVDEGIWLPEHVEVRAAAKVFFVKSMVIDRVLTWSEYRVAPAAVP